MALRRVLPSRATPDKTPDSAAAANAGRDPFTEKAARKATEAPAVEASPAPEDAFGSVPAPIETVPAQAQTSAMAAAATSAFSTLPAATPARVLEDSFTVAPQPEPDAPAASAPEPEASAFTAPAWEASTPVETPKAEPEFVAPAWQEPAAPEADKSEFVAPAWEEPAPAKAEEPAFTAPAWEEPATAPKEEPAFSAPAWEEPKAVEAEAPKADEFVAPAWVAASASVTTSAVQAAPMPTAAEPAEEPKAEPAFSAPAWEAPASEAAAPIWETTPAPQPEPEAAPAPAAAPAAPISFEPSRPDSNRKRRNRDKRPRDFSAMGAPEPKEDRPKPGVDFGAGVPVNTKSLDKVDEDLIASGIVAAPPPDSLTASVPGQVAESESPFFAIPEPQPEPEPVKLPDIKLEQPAAPEVVAVPAPVIEPAPQPAVEPVAIQVDVPVVVAASASVFTPPPAAPAAPLPPVAAPSPHLNERQPEAPFAGTPVMPEAAVSLPPEEPFTPTGFSLSNTPSHPAAPSAAPLPPPQSDLPWTQAQSAAEWEIEAPQNDAWLSETHQDAVASTPAASHMPTPGQDLYKSMGNGPAPILQGMGTVPPRNNPVFTPEIPGSRRKQAGGTPWALIAVGAVVAIGAAAYYMQSSSGGSKPQQQLANLTKTGSQTTGETGPDGMLLPPQTENVSFYTPPAVTASSSLISSSSVVNFADVPANEANQPIVATGTEKLPDDMSFFGKVGQEIDRIKAEQAGAPTGTSATTAGLPTPAAVDAATTRQNLNDELAAYRNALAQTSNPAALTPSAFKRDPDGYMDGKPQVAEASPVGAVSGTAMASGSLLPPPDLYTNNPKNLPVVAEPIANAPQRVRTLADFADIEPYMPEREKVEVPKNLKPKLAATDFPSLEVLSFVAGKGIVAFADGREGVLLIGESLNGWELVAVSPDNAEFKAGQKSYQVTSEN